MKILEEKRLAAVFAAYIGIFALYALIPSARAWLIPIAAIVIFGFAAHLLFWKKPRNISARKVVFAVLMAVSVAISSVSSVIFVGDTESKAEMLCDGDLHTADGYVQDMIYEEPYGSSYRVALTSVNGEETDFSAVVSFSYAAGLEKSDAVFLQGTFSPLTDEGFYQKAKGVFLYMEASFAEKTGIHPLGWENFFANTRAKIADIFERYIGDGAAFATAILTGERDALSGELRLAFTRMGVSHLLAVSGLHLSIIVGAFDLILRLLTVAKKKKALILIAVSLFFAFLCGLSASIVRAAVMLVIFHLSELFGERSDSVTALFFAVFLILVCHPSAVYDVGLWLSFFSTFGILSVMPVLLAVSFPEKMPRFLQKIVRFFLSVLGITVTATFFTMPVTYVTFGGISLISPLTNLILIPLMQILLYLLVIFLLLSWIPVVAAFLGAIAEFEIGLISEFAKTFSSWKNIYISIRYPFVWVILLILVLGILLVLFVKKLHTAWIFGVFLSCSLIFGIAFGIYGAWNQNHTYIYLQTDGKSDVVGMISRGEAVLIDISTGGYAMQHAAIQKLPDFYECEIDTYILTHYHSHHANSLRKLLETIKMHTLLLPEPNGEKDEQYLSEILSAVCGKVSVEYYKRDGEAVLYAGNLQLFLPETYLLKRSTHPVIGFSARIGEEICLSYVGASGMETNAVPDDTDIFILGSNGPKTKHIFSADALSQISLLIASEKSLLDFTETDRLSAQIVCAQDYGGFVSILAKTDS